MIPTRDANTIVATDIGDVQVASFRPDPATPPLTTSVLVDDDQQGGIHLVVEILDPTIKFTPQDHAQLLATIVNDT